jgi:DedD protein
MEKKKLLLVAVSVGVVMLIIIGIPLLLVSPRQSNSAQIQTSRTAVPFDMPQEPEIIEILEPVQILEPPVISEPVAPVETPRAGTINVPQPRTVAVPSAPAAVQTRPMTKPAVKPAAKPVAAANPVAEKPVATKPAETPVLAAEKPAAEKPAPVAVKQSAPKPADDKTYTNYWVQTGAFSTQVRDEGAKESLESKGIASIIDNSDINGKTWYRVRVGPYLSENEANYWLALVKSIEGFASSQVRITQAVQ